MLLGPLHSQVAEMLLLREASKPCVTLRYYTNIPLWP